MQQRKYEKLPEVLEALADSLSSEDPLTLEAVALLTEERADVREDLPQEELLVAAR